jgi:uncharacterized protein (TIGR00730 family)
MTPANDTGKDSPEQALGEKPLAYKNEEFLDSSDARVIRILAEYLQPLANFRREKIRDTIVFFGSARIAETGPLARYYHEARELARLLTQWANQLPDTARRFVVCSGGGPGIMEAANRGSLDAGGKSVGLNIGLPYEQLPNPFISPGLSFQFHYFFMRKFWFAYLGKALVVFPGGFGTMDELMEMLTLVQTQKLRKRMVVVIYGTTYWKEVINFDALVRHGTISPEDMNLFNFADDPLTALKFLQDGLAEHFLNREVPGPERRRETPEITIR